MYPNPLITIPRLQNSENEAGYPHSHPHKNRRAAVGRDDFGETGEARAKIAPKTASVWDEEESFQASVGTAQSTSQKASRIAPWTESYFSGMPGHATNPANQKFTSSGATTGALGNNVGGSAELEGGGIWGGIKDFAGDVGGGIKDFVTGDTGDGDVGMQGAFASKIAPPSDGDKVTSTFDETEDMIGGAISEPFTAQQWADAGYTQRPDGSWGIAPKKGGILPTIGSAGGKDIRGGDLEKAEDSVPDALRDDDYDLETLKQKYDFPDYWKSSEAFGEGTSTIGGREGADWDEESFSAAYVDLMENFWTKDEKFGPDKQGIGTAAEEIFASSKGRGDAYVGRFNSQKDLKNAIKSFIELGAKRKGSINLSEDQKREVLYHELKALAEGKDNYDEESYNTFAKEYLGITDDSIEKYGGTIERVGQISDDIDKTAAPIGTDKAYTDQYVNDISTVVAEMSAFKNPMAMGKTSGELIDAINQDVNIPPGYIVTRDVADQPVLQFKGRIEGYDKKTGAPKYSMKDEQGREIQQIEGTQLQGINSALQMREQGQATMQGYMEDQLGLRIKRQESQIMGAEFDKQMLHAADQLKLDEDKFKSNERFIEAETLGIFTDEGGNKKDTISRQELMAKLTGQVGTGEFENYLASVSDRDGNTMSFMAKREKTDDTVEMQKLKADLLGKFDNQDTISAKQFTAAVTGYLNAKPTFAREQFLEQQSIRRSDALTKAGKVLTQKYAVDAKGKTTSETVYYDPVTGEEKSWDEGGRMLETLEARRFTLDETIATAKLNQNQTARMALLDDFGQQKMELIDGKEVPMMQTVSVDYLDKMRVGLDQTRLDHIMAMETAAQQAELTGTYLDEEGKLQDTMASRQLGMAEAGQAIEQTRAESELARSEASLAAVGVEETRAGAEATRAETSAAQESRALQLQQAQIAETKAQGLAAQREGLGQFDTGIEAMATQRQTYLTGLNEGLTAATATNFSSLEASLGAPLPPVPAGMVWDGQSGTLKFRAGYEGRDINEATQREMEKIAPVLRARDRAEKVLTQLQTHKFNTEMQNATLDNESARIRTALMTGDIIEAEEAAYHKRNAENALVVARAKNEKYNMVLQLIQSPVALGLARRSGVLAKIEADLGFQISNVPEVSGDDATIPNYNEWISMTEEQKALKQTLWIQSTGNDIGTFQQMVAQSAPGATRVNVYEPGPVQAGV